MKESTGTDLPKKIKIVEVGPRDGFQMEERFIPTELKVEIIDQLSAAGIRDIEAVSFVHPRVIPQMADAAEVLASIQRRPGVRYLALVLLPCWWYSRPAPERWLAKKENPWLRRRRPCSLCRASAASLRD